jgi:hypothetical protein
MILKYICILFLLAILSCKKTIPVIPGEKLYTVTVQLNHRVGISNFAAGINYTNSHNENINISKWHYYMSNVQLVNANNNATQNEDNSYHLVKAEDAATTNFTFKIDNNNATQIKFLLGVDSTRNVNGAQTGALDPLNGMFWTWNSGYIMAKLEGNSSASNAVNNLIAYHIGGFSGTFNTLRWVTLNLPTALPTRANGNTTININANLLSWFTGIHDLKITDEPIMMNHGALAAKYADNYAKMFNLYTVVHQ